MTKRNKLQKILKALTTADDTAGDSFDEFDQGVKKLKSDLQEKVVVKTLDEVNGKLSDMREQLTNDLAPVINGVLDLKAEVTKKKDELEQLLHIKTQELAVTLKSSETKSTEEVTSIAAEIKKINATLNVLSRPKEDTTPTILKTIGELEEKTQLLLNDHARALSENSKTLKSTSDATQKTFDLQKTEFLKQITELRNDFTQRVNHLGGGSQNQQINVNSSVMSTKYADINFLAGTNVTLTKADDTSKKRVNITIAATGGGGGGTPGGADTQVQFNNAGSFGGSSGLTWNQNTSVLTSSVLTVNNVKDSTFEGKTRVTVGFAKTDYVVAPTGAAADVQLSLAIAQIKAAGGGHLEVGAGDFYITNTPTIDFDNITISGQGAATKFYMTNGWDGYIFAVDNATIHKQLEFKDFKIDGNASAQAFGGGIQAFATASSKFTNIWVANCKEYGIDIGGTGASGFGYTNEVSGCVFDVGTPVHLRLGTNDENNVHDNVFVDATQYNVYDTAGTQNIHHNIFVGGSTSMSTGKGVYSTSDNTIVDSNIFDGPHEEAVKIDGSRANVTNNRISKVTGTAAVSPIVVRTGSHNVVNGNIVNGGLYYPYALEGQNGTANNIVLGNDFESGTTAVTNVATAITVYGNFQLSDPGATKAYRFRTSGADLDFDFAGDSMYLSGYPNADFSGTQRFYLGLNSGSADADAFGTWRFHSVPFAATTVTIDPGSGTPLAVVGAVTVTQAVTASDFLLSSGGSSTDPSFRTTADPELGIYFSGTQTIGLAQGGNNIAIFNASGVQIRGTANTSVLVASGTSNLRGVVTTGVQGSIAGQVDFSGATTGLTRIQPASVAGNWTLTLPVDDGTAGQYLLTDGNGITQWASVTATGGSGITRSTSVISVSSTLAASATTDYVFFANVGIKVTMPTAIGNSNCYTIKNYTGTSSVLIAAATGQDIDGSVSALINPYQSLDLMSNGSVWGII